MAHAKERLEARGSRYEEETGNFFLVPRTSCLLFQIQHLPLSSHTILSGACMDDDSVLIEPRRIPGDPHIRHPIILNLFGPYFDFLRKELRVKKSSLKQLRFPSMTCCTGAADGREISVIGTPLGAPQAALLLERLIAMGATRILAFGCCGSLQPDVEVGTLVVPTTALSEEGTSPHYPLPRGKEARADEPIVALCRRGKFGPPMPSFEKHGGRRESTRRRDSWPWRWRCPPSSPLRPIGTYRWGASWWSPMNWPPSSGGPGF